MEIPNLHWPGNGSQQDIRPLCSEKLTPPRERANFAYRNYFLGALKGWVQESISPFLPARESREARRKVPGREPG